MPANFAWCAVALGLIAPFDVGTPRAEPPDRPGFVVRDGETSRPVANASVRVIDPFGDEDETFSDARGRAESRATSIWARPSTRSTTAGA